MRGKHRNDHNHGKNGWVSGNPRYGKGRAALKSDRPKDKRQAKKEMDDSSYLATGTKVVSKKDGKIGIIMNGFGSNGFHWDEYEVATDNGIERWKRSELFVQD